MQCGGLWRLVIPPDDDVPWNTLTTVLSWQQLGLGDCLSSPKESRITIYTGSSGGIGDDFSSINCARKQTINTYWQFGVSWEFRDSSTNHAGTKYWQSGSFKVLHIASENGIQEHTGTLEEVGGLLIPPKSMSVFFKWAMGPVPQTHYIINKVWNILQILHTVLENWTLHCVLV